MYSSYHLQASSTTGRPVHPFGKLDPFIKYRLGDLVGVGLEFATDLAQLLVGCCLNLEVCTRHSDDRMAKSPSLLYRAFKQTSVEYFQKTSLNGFQLLYSIRRRKYQRIFWFCFIVMGIMFATYVVLFTLFAFLADPTVTTLSTNHSPIWDVPFPAVAVCSVNKLSRQKVAAFAEDLNSDSMRRSTGQSMQSVDLLAGLFDSSSVNAVEAKEFQKELHLLKGNISVDVLMRRLAPSCSDLMLRCLWAGETSNCSEMFPIEPTALGHCCVFNYQRARGAKSHKDQGSRPLLYPKGSGFDSGLSLLLNASTDDYFYAAGNTNGFVVMIFGPDDFPDPSTGSVQQFYVSPGEDVEIHLSVVRQESDRAVRDFSIEQRHCVFPDEYWGEYGVSYSQAECLSRCKIRSMRDLCGCVPFYMAVANDSNAICSLEHVECLQKYQTYWETYRPKESVGKEVQFTQERTMNCENCYPLCSYRAYSGRKRSSKLNNSKNLKENLRFLRNSSFDLDEDGAALLKLFFPTPYAVKFSKNALFNWYEILSNIGGVLGISIGCSVISGFELVYFFGYQWYENLQKLRKVAAKS